MLDIAQIHPMLIHFPLALIPVALAGQAVALYQGNSLFGRACISSSAVTLIVLAALGAVAAALFGDIALDKAVDAGVPPAIMETHEELGISSATLISILAVVETWLHWKTVVNRAIDLLMWGTGLAILAVLLTTAWFGGHLVYDSGVNVKSSIAEKPAATAPSEQRVK